MRVVVIGSAKGGVGKSTLSAALAVEAERQGGRVAILDLDDLQCLARWHDQRVVETGLTSPLLIKSKMSPRKAMAHATKAGCDWLIIDTAPGSLARLQLALKIADICLVPVRPSPLDVQCMDAVVELCHSTVRQTLIILNSVARGSQMKDGARAYLSMRGFSVWDQEIAQDELHVRAMLTGRTASELSPKSVAAKGIKALWDSVEKMCDAGAHLQPRKRSRGRSRA